jgi:hypothetical protein
MASREKSLAHYRNLRMEMIEAYGGQCVCCGENIAVFLTLDHVNNDGHEHRKRLNKGKNNQSSVMVWHELKRAGWPKEGFQLLCYNCNCGKDKNWGGIKVCPHEQITSAFLRLPPKTVKAVIGRYQSQQMALFSTSCQI